MHGAAVSAGHVLAQGVEGDIGAGRLLGDGPLDVAHEAVQGGAHADGARVDVHELGLSAGALAAQQPDGIALDRDHGANGDDAASRGRQHEPALMDGGGTQGGHGEDGGARAHGHPHAGGQQRAAGGGEAPRGILGMGVNIGQEVDDLPVAWAGSLRTLGVVDADGDSAHAAVAEVALNAIGHQLARRLEQWEGACGDVDAGDGTLGRELRAALTTLGQHVSVQAPDGELSGLAVDVTPALVLRNQAGDTEVRAGDVTLVRVTG